MYSRTFAKRKKTFYAVFAVLALILLAGCGNSTTTTSPASSTPLAQQKSSNTGFTTTGGNVGQATLQHVPTGTAQLSWDHTTKILTIQVNMTGLAPNSIHPNHIHEGVCGSQGKVLYPLTKLVADTHGVAQAITRINLPDGIPAKGLYLNVHNGPSEEPADQFLPIACSNIVNTNTSLRSNQAMQLTLQAPTNSANENASGSAHLSLSGQTLTVQVEMSGLQPDSEHAVHIHRGSCTSEGPVLYPLTVLKANAEGKATATTTIQHVTTIPSTGWYVNVHRTTDLSTQTGFDPIACGDVTIN